MHTGQCLKTIDRLRLSALVCAAPLHAGEALATFSTMPPALPHVKSGKMKGLGMTSPRRNPPVPDVLAMSEIRPGFEVMLYSGDRPAGLPEPVVSRANGEIAKAIKAPDVRSFTPPWAHGLARSSEQFNCHLQSQIAKLGGPCEPLV